MSCSVVQRCSGYSNAGQLAYQAYCTFNAPPNPPTYIDIPELCGYVGSVVRLYGSSTSRQGCWTVVNSSTYGSTDCQTPGNFYFTPYGVGDCELCQKILWAKDCNSNKIRDIYGSGTNDLHIYADTNQVIHFDPGITPVSGEMFSCFTVIKPARYSPEELGLTLIDTPLDLDTSGYSLSTSPGCAECTAIIKCIRLTDCATGGLIYDYYLEDTDILGSSLIPIIGGFYQLTIPVTLVNEVTGLPPDVAFTSCFNILSSDRDPGGSPGCGKHSVVIGNNGGNCNNCEFCYRFVSCDTPGESYTVRTIDGNFHEAVQVCEQNGVFGSVLSIKIDLHDGKGSRCFKVEACIDSDPVIILDEYYPLDYEAYCDTTPCTVCLTEPICYLVTFCESGQQITLQDPTVEDGGDIPLGNYYQGRIELPRNALIGCFTIEETACGGVNPAPVTGANIVIDGSPRLAYASCEECLPPPSYKISRCDDPGIYYIVNTDLAFENARVIRNITLYNCTTGSIPCKTTAEQCWLVTQVDHVDTLVEVLYDSDIFPDCSCCEETPLPS